MKTNYIVYAGVILVALAVVPLIHAQSAMGGVVLTTDKSSYVPGEPVAVSLTNNGYSPYQYSISGCSPNFKVLDSNGNSLAITNPQAPNCDHILEGTIPAGQSVSIGSWDQTEYACTSALGPMDCQATPAPAGTYTVAYSGLVSTPFTIGGNQAPPNPPFSFTNTFQAGWNMFSVPVYNQPSAPGGQLAPPTVTSSTCTPANAWHYDTATNSYVQVGINNLDSSTGYWIYEPSACSTQFSGTGEVVPIAGGAITCPNGVCSTGTKLQYSQDLVAGWNMISTSITAMNFSQLLDSYVQNSCSGKVTSGPWAYDGYEYVASESMAPGQAYWVQASSACTLSGPLAP